MVSRRFLSLKGGREWVYRGRKRGGVCRGSEDNHSPGVGCSVETFRACQLVEHGYTEVVSMAIRNKGKSTTCHHCLHNTHQHPNHYHKE